MSDEQWSEERLANAYRARFGQAQSAGLADAALERVRTAHRPRASFAPFRLAAAATALIVLVGSASVLAPLVDDGNRSPRPSAPPRDPAAGFPESVLGLPVVSVSEALAIGNAGADDTEIAVRGYLPPPPRRPLECPAPVRQPTPVEHGCPEFFTDWLTEVPQRIVRETETSSEGGSPTGPAINYVKRLEVPWDDSLGPRPDDEPLPVVIVGHFDDYRSVLCPAEERDRCRRTFVVDARAWVASEEGPAGPTIVVANGRPPTLSADQAAALASGRLGQAIADPWLAAVDGGLVGDIDPRALDHPELAQANVVWVVRELVSDDGRPVARTMFLADDSRALFATLGAGVTALDASEPPELAFPAELLGLPVISVANAVARRDGDQVDDTAVAVAGWYADAGPVPCPSVPDDIGPIWPRCPDGFRWLMGLHQSLGEGAVESIGLPAGPTLNPILRPEIEFGALASLPSRAVVPVVLLGHFGDRRADTLAERREFVVDAVLWIEGREVTPGVVNLDATPVTDAGVVETLIDARVGPAIAAWPTVMTGDWVSRIEPKVAATLGDAEQVWRVRRLVEQEGRAVVRTAWMIDGDGRVWWDEHGDGPALEAIELLDPSDEP